MTMIFHFVRHPLPDIADGVCYGRLDVAAQASEAAAGRLRPLLPTAPLYSSPLRRCRELAECLHPAPIFDARLQEMHFGAWEGLSWDEIGAEALAAWAADVAGFVPPAGESGLAVQGRALDCLRMMTDGGGEVVVVTHAGVMRALLAHWLGLPAQRWLELRFAFAHVTSVEIDAAGHGRVLRLNA